MKKALDFLAANPVTYFATIGRDGPKVRPIQYCFEKEGSLWFCTAKSKKFHGEMQDDPRVEFCAFDGNRWIRVSGTVAFDDDMEVKKSILDRYDGIRGIYKTPDNPDFVSFRLKNWTATLYSFTDAPETFSR